MGPPGTAAASSTPGRSRWCMSRSGTTGLVRTTPAGCGPIRPAATAGAPGTSAAGSSTRGRSTWSRAALGQPGSQRRRDRQRRHHDRQPVHDRTERGRPVGRELGRRRRQRRHPRHQAIHHRQERGRQRRGLAGGGGIVNSGRLIVTESTISHNRVRGQNGGVGGGIANGFEYGCCDAGDVLLTATRSRATRRAASTRASTARATGPRTHSGWWSEPASSRATDTTASARSHPRATT